jgi:hypothetical protein
MTYLRRVSAAAAVRKKSINKKEFSTHLNLNLNKYTLMRGENIMTILYITVNDVKNVRRMNQNHRKM